MSTDDRSRQWYEENAEAYTKHVRDGNDSVYHSMYEKPVMYELLPDLSGKSVISLGCGSGEDCHYLQTHGANEVTGIDLSDKLIDIAASSYPECDFKTMDMEHLDFPDQSFDLAYSSLAIHYIEDWHQVFSEVYRVLKPGAYFLFSCNHPVASSPEVTQDDEKLRTTQLTRTRDKSTGTITIIGDYVTRRALSSHGDMAVTTWHKSIDEIATEATDEGFLIANIREPKPKKEMEKLFPNDYLTLRKIPYFIIFKLLKPGLPIE